MTSPLSDPCWDNLAATWDCRKVLAAFGGGLEICWDVPTLMQVESQGRSDLDNDQLFFGCQILCGTSVLHLGDVQRAHIEVRDFI
jgi:hypothetical protein